MGKRNNSKQETCSERDTSFFAGEIAPLVGQIPDSCFYHFISNLFLILSKYRNLHYNFDTETLPLRIHCVGFDPTMPSENDLRSYFLKGLT